MNSMINKWGLDNIYTHICALALIVDNFDTDIADIRDDLSIDTKT